MTGWRERLDVRTVVMVIVLDSVTFLLVYWLAFPAFSRVLDALNTTTAQGVQYTTEAVRLCVVGLLAARSLRRRRGLLSRGAAVPSIAVGAVVALVLGLAAGIASRALLGVGNPSALAYLAAIVEGMVFPVFGLLFVTPGPAEKPVLVGRSTRVGPVS